MKKTYQTYNNKKQHEYHVKKDTPSPHNKVYINKYHCLEYPPIKEKSLFGIVISFRCL